MDPISTQNDPIIKIEDVSVSYGPVNAVNNVTLNVEIGIIFGLVGSDGAGKSTLLRTIAGMIRPSSGHIIIDGLDVVNDRAQIKPLIGYMPQRFGLYKDLTVIENLYFFMDIFRVFGAERKRRTERYLGFSNLLPFTDKLTGDLSGGMKQKLGLACVLCHEPKILILDEPTNGVDPVSRAEFWDMLFAMRKEGMTILISTAYLDEGERCDSLALMHKSKIIISADPATIRADFESLEEAVIEGIKDADEELVHDRFGI
ncbi:MAG TPA: ABC transporter ATP-binding protein [Desulfatiglandales bacterium]|nr:ABC transporter ATP-binding protein [Desulfatiglandales bacterium]